MKSSRKLVCLMLCTILAFTSCSEGGKNQSSSTAEESSQVELAAKTTGNSSEETTDYPNTTMQAII